MEDLCRPGSRRAGISDGRTILHPAIRNSTFFRARTLKGLLITRQVVFSIAVSLGSFRRAATSGSRSSAVGDSSALFLSEIDGCVCGDCRDTIASREAVACRRAVKEDLLALFELLATGARDEGVGAAGVLISARG